MNHRGFRPVLLVAGASAILTAVPPVLSNETTKPIIPPGHVGAAQHADMAEGGLSSPLIARIVDIVDNPAAFTGRRVVLTSQVEKIYSPWSMLLREDPPLANGSEPRLLLVSTEPISATHFKQEWQHRIIKAIGVIRILRPDDFRRTYGRGLDDKLFRQYEGKPALVAESFAYAN